jgi:hypothetical protein
MSAASVRMSKTLLRCAADVFDGRKDRFTVPVPAITSKVFFKIVEYLHYHEKHPEHTRIAPSQRPPPPKTPEEIEDEEDERAEMEVNPDYVPKPPKEIDDFEPLR